MTEYDFEPVRGLPGDLPAGERILWQGEPRYASVARRFFHVRLLGWYFAAMLGARLVASLSDGATFAESATSLALLALSAALAVGLLVALAWALSRATVYTITNRRVVIRLGVALPMTVNIPFRAIESAGIEYSDDGTGDLTFVLEQQSKIAYLSLWPHLRPWQFAHPRPMLRAVPHPGAVAKVLADALAAATMTAGGARTQTGTTRDPAGPLSPGNMSASMP